MSDDAFLARVRDRGEYTSREEAAVISHAVLAVLAQHLGREGACRLAARLPERLAGTVSASCGAEAEDLEVEEFCRRVAGHTGIRPRTPQWDIHAVVSTVADALSPGERGALRARLPIGLTTLLDPEPPG
ncbi:DUF2267 domain-containing protein [Streptomyces sp. NPDC051018]|uniref:DUF2267 domain-containing protein n=1 Tax=Streptomyces sp. NPDC051018 TaxID=3365639 RepID=UPI003787B65A